MWCICRYWRGGNYRRHCVSVGNSNNVNSSNSENSYNDNNTADSDSLADNTTSSDTYDDTQEATSKNTTPLGRFNRSRGNDNNILFWIFLIGFILFMLTAIILAIWLIILARRKEDDECL